MDADNEASGGFNLAERIRRLATGRNTLDVAQFQFIGIAEIRARYGERWAEKKARVSQVARQFISRRMAQDDVLVAGADGFLLVFGGVTGVMATMATQRITKELNAFFLGEPDLDGIQLDARHDAMSLDEFVRTFSAMMAEAREAERAPVQVAMGWFPVWDARRGALATYFISPLDAATGLPLEWDSISHRHADMDEKKLIASEVAMRTLFAGGRRALVGVAAHITSFSNPQSLARMVQSIVQFDPDLARYRVLRLTGVEPGYPRMYLEDILRTVRQHAPRVAIGLNWQEPDVLNVLKMKPAAIGFSLPWSSMTHPATRAEVFTRVAAAVQQAKTLGVMVGVEGDIAPEHALRFRQDGVTFICSPRIWPIVRSLPAGETWPAARLEAMAPAETAA